MRGLVVVAVATCFAACGSSGGSSPTAPTQPTITQVGGVWQVTNAFTAITQSECVGQTMVAMGAIGTGDTGSAQFSQNGSSLTAVYTSNTNGAARSYSGTAGSNTITLNFTGCNLCNVVNFQCANGELRDLVLQADGINATVSGNTMSGIEAEVYNVFLAGTTTSAGILFISARVSASKQ
jgi:hypothetical protein